MFAERSFYVKHPSSSADTSPSEGLSHPLARMASMTATTSFRTCPASAGAVYAQRRLVAGALLVLLGAVLWTLATWATDSSVGVTSAGADATGSEQMYIVQPGDTLWSIAAELNTNGDVRDTVDRIAAENGGSAIAVGQRLQL